MNKPRIVIRAFTCRRDTASALLLANILEEMGCEVLVTSTRDFLRTVKYWRPNAVVVNTRSGPISVKSLFPDMKVIQIDGEGLSPDKDMIAQYYYNNMDVYDACDEILLWGNKAYDEVISLAKLRGREIGKVHVVGNIHFDFVKYMPEKLKDKEKYNSIGFATRYRSINDHEGRSTLKYLPNKGNLDDTIFQCKSFVGMIDCIKELLEKTTYNISIRPHPLEQINSYKEYLQIWFGKDNVKRITIDESLSFSQWAVKQQAILSPTSTSFMKAYLLKVPVINIDLISDTHEYCKQLEENLSEDWQSAGIAPKNINELVKILSNEIPAVTLNEDIERQLVEYCDYNNNESSCLRAAKVIFNCVRNSNIAKRIYVPKWLVNKIDDISFARASRRNPCHYNLNYKRGFHPSVECLDEITKTIIRSDSN